MPEVSARRFWYSQGQTARTRFVALEHGFSGRTFGALSVTASRAYREPFEPLVPGVTFVPPGDEAALEAAVTTDTAAIIVEPIQGEGGVRPLGAAYAAAIERVTAATGALLIADEVQCGLGRTGAPFYFQVLGLTPDLVSVGKALGSGVPVGAALVSEAVAARVFAGDHGSTYGGNLLSMRAALYVLDQLVDGGLLAHVREVGDTFGRALAALAAAMRARGWRLATAESCTGGLLAAACTELAGSSDWFERGFVTYSNEAKTAWLGVPEALIRDHGAVSEPVARAMAEGVRARSGVEVGVGITGIAGPGGGTPEKPVGLVVIAVATPAGTDVRTCRFVGGRVQVKTFASGTAIDFVRRALIGIPLDVDWGRAPAGAA
ncbi:MAG: aminotransferase class III-fold pyridoxal phosphate-dependent enzyme [Vicinamibacteria bacterium]